MKFIKLLALLLATVLCLSVLGGCISSDPDEDEIIEEDEDKADKEEEKSDEGDGKTDENKKPNQNSSNVEDFTFLHIRQLSGDKDYYGGNYLDADSDSGKTIEKSVYKRNKAVEEKLNVNIVERIEDNVEPADFLQTVELSEDYTFDAIYAWGYKLSACAVEGYLGDISALPGVDIAKDYWNPTAVESLMINDKLYMAANDISMNRLNCASVVFFNKQLFEDFDVSAGMGGKTFYDLVRDGDWTIDKLLQAVQHVNLDMDGDGSVTNNDIYGIIDPSGSGESFGLGCGINITQRNDDGSYTVSYYNDKSYAIASKINDVFSNDKYVKSYEDFMMNADIPEGFSDIFEYCRSFFSTGHSLFTTGSIMIAEEFRDMEDGYGILPMPKADARQENYISPVESNGAMFAIPANYRIDVDSACPERTGKVLEAMSKLSADIVFPVYYDTIVKHGPNSNEDMEMLDIIYNSVHYEFAYMFNSYLFDITDAYSYMFFSPSTSSSTYRRKAKLMQKELDALYIDLTMIESNLEN